MTRFCCDSVKPHKPFRTTQDAIFNIFLKETECATKSTNSSDTPISTQQSIRNVISGRGNHVIQFVTQKNFGPVLTKEYFRWDGNSYTQIDENEVKETPNMEKVRAFKNFVCRECGLFYEVNLYMIAGSLRSMGNPYPSSRSTEDKIDLKM
uniref:Uncharacterized protein n=1 Tax=Percolomonas cosmopolitus TaxID=63605 RepID=A0A7S1KUS5_9EUKA|mmetsp:Transcript_9420/g.34982  ORF Transcript_9420/g.34982 Transcript_9420/m.34982 type:complete len:151 (+) Transcript_9420:869-1321(+)|eukprot:CAMPEP_0117434906 /NCGR_PEP_ID=MMETSP0759-20121206/195_1 /TAXON_ID=63605 /ORGANISM="Percolomonas cosmopolitus, Strain WS" /LENGTH=150 /DNA_ID=CAMNT_0005226413 /DNA_START=820 /DNA_END=1272 /DNA_ORIENTATION=+